LKNSTLFEVLPKIKTWVVHEVDQDVTNCGMSIKVIRTLDVKNWPAKIIFKK
jgi:hypothetical protein